MFPTMVSSKFLLAYKKILVNYIERIPDKNDSNMNKTAGANSIQIMKDPFVLL